MNLHDVPISDIKGIGEKLSKLFYKLNIISVYDLITYFPRDYVVYPKITYINEAKAGEYVAVLASVCSDFYIKKTSRVSIGTVNVHDNSGQIILTFFGMDYLRKVLKPGSNFVFYGNIKQHGNMFCMESPKIFSVEEYNDLHSKLLPVYSLTKGLSGKTVTKTVLKALENYETDETLPDGILKKYNLLSLKESIKGIHYPENKDELIKFRRRIVFEEFYTFLYKIRQSKEDNLRIPSEYLLMEVADTRRLTEALPYSLTNAQKNAFNDILNDFSSGYCMRRLIQGDVGSGKTIVAILAAITAAANGYQAAIMAPTEVLSLQHYNELIRLKEKYKLRINPCLLTGSLKQSEKNALYNGILNREYDIVIGTHALFQEKVVFNNLSFVVTDEQHRFGVRQRESLSEKGNKPHVLIMSATPIPRTLAACVYADLNVSIIDELPSVRLPIKTCVIGKDKRSVAYSFIKQQLADKHQAYIICPMVEENDEMTCENVTTYGENLKNVFGDDVRIEILHGKMKPAVKNHIMDEFSDGNIDILVSTTVVEVGVNVPNATVIMIENAERFGLASLHQLRGRVGRSNLQSYCIFVDCKDDEKSRERLEILNKSNDGFYIANEDLRLRGPGDIFGIRQSGEMNFKIADIYSDSDILMQALEYVNSL